MHSAAQSLKQYLQSRFQKDTTVAEANDGLVMLPDVLENQIAKKLQALPSPTPYQETVKTEISAAIEAWQQNLDAPNSLVLLGNPVEPIANILNDSLRQWVDPPASIITPLRCVERPLDPWQLKRKVEGALMPYAQIEPPETKDTDQQPEPNSLDNRKTLILVPCLEQCFLRCIGGWESIEYLRDIAIHHRNCFWVMGCNHWAWNFLDFVCQVSAYFSEVKALPELDGEMLKDWLDPVVKTIIATPEKEKVSEEEEGDRPEYWDVLARKSLGVSSVAKSLWLQSLRIEAEIIEETEDLRDLKLLGQDTDQKEELNLLEVRPTLPNLPTLSGNDRYLLHSLLIHGHMTRAHLAFSLGQQEGQIQSAIQALLRKGLLERANGGLRVEATHYAKLKMELSNNNFFVGDD
ncbi:hypothetical protein Lepto7376_1215 [[Leptolyngbya] sp. PCC 7376]|uniref:MarR family transcriptional regulator n=1 Tax=[Leptolyngbya] sp. PCC 7376 TaxID=111781 RepID=UPI00029ED468|nr:helix-turn-helix domain-containing protein [[Leptolyngbya] sp. PCC 7376]AFY37572.1 hypothetical protein Lepto7376_1215 [[Leptolyngbya] sp. PCC 7376]